MNTGNFYFIHNSFYKKYQKYNLMGNKITGNRPCYYCLDYNSYSNINMYLMIPTTTQITKCKNEYDKKIKRYGVCDSIVFGDLQGKENAFLLQNMFLVIDKYILNVYKDRNNVEVSIKDVLKNELLRKSKKLLGINNTLIEKGKEGVIFTDIKNLEKELILDFYT